MDRVSEKQLQMGENWRGKDERSLFLCKIIHTLEVTYHLIYGMNNFVTNKSKLPLDGHNCFLILGDWLSCEPCEGYHVTHVRVT